MSNLAERIAEAIQDEINSELWHMEERIEAEYEETNNNLHQLNEYLENHFGWIKLPDYPLMQHQKDAINEAIEKVLRG